MKRLRQIEGVDLVAINRARRQWAQIAKPLRSLGLLEDAVVKIAGIIGNGNVVLDKRCVIVMCSDNGVVKEGVAQVDSSVTRCVAESMVRGKANINLMAKTLGADVRVVDIGMDTDSEDPEIINVKCGYGTADIAKQPAMTREQAEKCIAAGIDQVKWCKEQGYQIIVTGEMGIGNTTTSSAVAAVLLGESVEKVTGRGSGLSNKGLQRKIAVIQRAIHLAPIDPGDPIDVLSKVGGYDIAGMTGVFLGGAIYRIPIIMDGLISYVAALLAVRCHALAKEYMLCSHVSKEPASQMLLDALGLKAVIHGELGLGEGAGGILLLPLLDSATAVYHGAHCFEDLAIEAYREHESC